MKVTVEREIGGRALKFETGELAKQAHGAVVVQYGETWVFVATVSGPPRSADQDFFPLTVDYRERFAAAGKFPGGFLKRESRPSTREILTARLTDRPIRPLFPEGYYDEVQVMSNVLSVDGENDPDVLSINGASAALMLAPVPFNGPIGAVRIGLIDDQFVVMPTLEQTKASRLDLVVAGSKDSVLMIEGFADQLPEDQMADAIMLAQREIAKICELQEELCAKVGKQKTPAPVRAENPFTALLKSEVYAQLKAAKLLLMTDVAGVKDETGATLASLTRDKARDLIARKVADGGMIPKLECALDALDAGVGKVHIVDGRMRHALLLEIFTDRGIGTEVV